MPFDGSPADVESGADVFNDVGGDTTADASVGVDIGPDGGADAGPDVAIFDVCEGSRPDGGVMDVTPSCGPSPTAKGGEMCEVPAGPFWMGADSTWMGDKVCPASCGSVEPFREVVVPEFGIDRFEVTVGDYEKCVAGGFCTPARCKCRTYGCVDPPSNSEMGGREDHPVNCVDWYQATAYCAWAGKRLPTEAEWEKAARGTDGRIFPWGGDPPDCDRAVLSLPGCDVQGTSRVGTKPAGASPYGVEDILGNVDEWTADHGYFMSYYSAPADGRSYDTNLNVESVSAAYVRRGRCWSDRMEEAEQYNLVLRFWTSPESRDPVTGLRCALSGKDWGFRRDGATGERKIAAVPIEDRVFSKGVTQSKAGAGGGGALPGIACSPSSTGRGGEMCEVPEGAFPMGCRDLPGVLQCPQYYQVSTLPLHEVWLSAFKIDRHEVTADEYRACVEAGACGLPANVNVVCNERCTFAVPGREDYPVNCVLWEQARDYCAWAGKRLPTEAEWEKAAGGPEGFFWPWGNDDLTDNHNYYCQYGGLCKPFPGTDSVGTRPLAVSPYGALDMFGNVWEWVNDWYDEDYYANSPAVDPPGPTGGYVHVLRGASWEYFAGPRDNKVRYAVFHPAYWNETVGFRCAY